MPKYKDIDSVLVIGSGPIQIGQAAEFDYSGSQACKSLREEGVKTILVNSNPATIQTDLEIADKIYLEPLTPKIVAKIIERENPDALLPTMGGQTALNVATKLSEMGALKDIKVIGSSIETIQRVEDREMFANFMKKIGEPVPKYRAVNSVEEAFEAVEEIGFPVIVRPAYTLGGTGGGVAKNKKELEEVVSHGLKMSLVNQVLIDQSVIGWKEFEYEVMRDRKGTCITVCNMENVDPMGIHTGESIVVAPAQTLSDEDNQKLRSAALKIIDALGIEGGCNIQFALNPETGDYLVIEVNPRVSRSSALASKATGYPIAKIAAKIAIGLTLDEIQNDITKETPASFEPTLDYVVTKIPRWPFDKFREIDRRIGVQMKSTGEVMAIGRTIEESFHKAIRSLDIGKEGFYDTNVTEEDLKYPTDKRLFKIYSALKKGWSIEKIHKLTKIDKFFLYKILNIVKFEKKLTKKSIKDPKILRKAKRMGFSDKKLAEICNVSERYIRKLRRKYGIRPAYKIVDTCAAEFEAKTPYYYSTYDDVDEVEVSDKNKVLIIGSGPIRIGQGIEFDYCCVHAALALKNEGFETIMVNNNPETVSTDYDVSDKLYFEPLTAEDVLEIIEKEKPDGVIVQFGGQSSINLAEDLEKEGVKILGTPYESIDKVEDRERFTKVLKKLGIPHPPYGIARSFKEAKKIAKKIGYPVLVRPSYVLGGRAMEIVYNDKELKEYIEEAVKVSPRHPILIDKFLEDAIEVDVDALSDGEDVFIAGIMEHIEEAGVHSGDSACVIPPQTLSKETIETIEEYTRKLALELKVVGLINIQYAVKNENGKPKVYVLEANPRASRTVPFVSKAIGISLAKIAAMLMVGKKLSDFNLKNRKLKHVAVKESVFPFVKLPGADVRLGPEMKSTGETMGIDKNFGLAYYKSQLGADMKIPTSGNILISVKDSDKGKIKDIVKKAEKLGFNIIATKGTAEAIKDVVKNVKVINKVSEKSPNIKDALLNGEIDLVINTPHGKRSMDDGYIMRRMAVDLGIPYITTLAGARAALNAIEAVKQGKINVKSLNEYHKEPDPAVT
ncbi:carbamoyl-phosphate synthase large subunit [Methanothermus fervidus DSM 2088]|uniref:Carbamoyl phosphate synthase large chain n=1 Tax=Methanothermus fervidus (strain ATCC 43054 / DSM 2088 / JCM 10308 / V24 S) TaxID=523846 RepID=E3GXS3_METFV|nr:carbamoyl-phosphate synthase large subunit [Methanothermus fervidus]ADP77105.1 carbamoyl-phosphate synthase large subunit [Methanothermus fervidus DSM 2088]